MTAAANHHASEYLDALFVAFNHFRMHTHSITHAEVRGDFAKLFRLNFI
jgi:hypothetical protein